MMNLRNPMNKWYTDRMDIFRVEEYSENYITYHKLVLVASKVPCRIYRSPATFTEMTMTKSEKLNGDKLACNIGVDIEDGDKLVVYRGNKLGYSRDISLYIAGDPVQQYEPVGGVSNRIDHQEIPLGGYRKLSQDNLDQDIRQAMEEAGI